MLAMSTCCESQPRYQLPEGNGRLVNHLFDQVKQGQLRRAVLDYTGEIVLVAVDFVTIGSDGETRAA